MQNAWDLTLDRSVFVFWHRLLTVNIFLYHWFRTERASGLWKVLLQCSTNYFWVYFWGTSLAWSNSQKRSGWNNCVCVCMYRAVVKKRKAFEYKLRRKVKEKADFLNYIQVGLMHCCLYSLLARNSIYAIARYMLSSARPSVCPSISVHHTGGSVKNGLS